MPRHRRRFRIAAFAWAVLQIALPALALFADSAAAAGASPSVGAHVEEDAGCTSRAAHELDCAICQHLSSPVGVKVGDAAVFPSATRVSAVALDRARALNSVWRELPTSRAPPLS